MLIIVTIVLAIFMFRQGRMMQFGKGGKSSLTVSTLVITVLLIWLLSLQLSVVAPLLVFILQNFIVSSWAFVIGVLIRKRVVLSELKALNRCDGCGTTFRDFYGLKKVEGKGFLCATCRSADPAIDESKGLGTGQTD